MDKPGLWGYILGWLWDLGVVSHPHSVFYDYYRAHNRRLLFVVVAGCSCIIAGALIARR